MNTPAPFCEMRNSYQFIYIEGIAGEIRNSETASASIYHPSFHGKGSLLFLNSQKGVTKQFLPSVKFIKYIKMGFSQLV